MIEKKTFKEALEIYDTCARYNGCTLCPYWDGAKNSPGPLCCLLIGIKVVPPTKYGSPTKYRSRSTSR